MTLSVRTRNAMLLGNGLIAQVRKVQDHQRTHGKPPQRPYLTYAQLAKQTGARLALVGIGNFLDEIMDAIHAPGVPPALRGLTLFVTNAKGQIDYTGDHWFGITPQNALQHRKAALDHDWSDMAFVATDAEE